MKSFRIIFRTLSLLGFFVSALGTVLAQNEGRPSVPTGNTLMLEPVSQYMPSITLKQREEIKSVYRKMANNPTWQRWFLNQRKDQLADPLDRRVMKALLRHREGFEFLPDAMAQLEKIIRRYGMDHRSSGTLISEKQGDELKEILATVKALAEWMPFSDAAINKAEIYALQGPMNAYTWSGTPGHIGAAFFDDLIEGLNSYERAQVIGHELAHILNEHILMGIWLDAIFYATAKNMIPDEEWPDEAKDKKREDKDLTKAESLSDVRAARAAKIEAALTSSARELIAHSGKIADHKPEYVATLRELVRNFGDKIAAKQTKNSPKLRELAEDLIRSVNGLKADDEVVINKEQEQAFEEAKKRLSRSKETSSDRYGGAYLQLLFSDGTPEMQSVLDEARRGAYVRLSGSKFASVPESLAQAKDYFSEMTDREIAAAFRNPGGSHPLVLARMSQFDAFENSDAFLVVSDPFLSLLFDYFTLTRNILDIDEKPGSEVARELSDRQVEGAEAESLKKLAALMSDQIQAILVAEILAVHRGERTDFNATKMLWFTVSKGLDRSGTSSWIPGRNGELESLGRPRRLIGNLVVQLKSEAEKLDISIPSEETEDVVEALPLPEENLVKGVPKPAFLAETIKLFSTLVKPDAVDKRITALDALAAACNSRSQAARK